MRLVLACLCGLIFGTGILVSGMANPAKVMNFFDIAGTWDPSLALVMGGALLVAFPGYRLVLRRSGPLVGDGFQLPARDGIDLRLTGGAALFGIGWGIAGFCPGAALPALGTGRAEVFIFVLALVSGILLARLLQRSPARPPAAETRGGPE